ncbi:MAG: 1 protein, partial [Bacteroidota bacterium]|nr:1 protein [Bacteroidota bacterium]
GIDYNNIFEELAPENSVNSVIFDEKKLYDIAELYRIYQNLLANRLLDYPELVRKVNGIFRAIKNAGKTDELFPTDNKGHFNAPDKLFTGKKLIYLYGFSEFKMPEIEFLSFFDDSKIPTAVSLDFTFSNGPLFGNLFDTINKLHSDGFLRKNMNKDDKSSVNVHLQPSEYLRKWLFNTEKEIRNDEFLPYLKVLALENRQDEVKTIAKLIKHLNAEKGISLSEICVTMRKPGLYSDMFRDIFHSNGIPVNISDRYELSSSTVVVSIFSVFDVITKGFRKDDIHRCMKSPFLSFLRTEKGNTIKLDADNFIETANRLRITGGGRKWQSYWLDRLSLSADSLKMRIRNLKSTDDYDTMDIKHFEKALESTVSALSDIKSFFELLPEPKKKLKPQELAEIIKFDIIKRFRIKENILGDESLNKSNNLSGYKLLKQTDELEKECRAFSEFIKILDETTFVLSKLHDAKTFSFEEFTAILKTAVSGAKYQIHEKPGYGVTITAIEQTRGVPFRVMILCGAVDCEFPLAYRSETMLGKELADSKDRHIRAERLLFYQFLTNNFDSYYQGKRLIYITYPKFSGTQELVPSQFIASIFKITAPPSLEHYGNFIDFADLRRKANSGESTINKELSWAKSISTIEEYHEFLGLKNTLKSINHVNSGLSEPSPQGNSCICRNDKDQFLEHCLINNKNNLSTEDEKSGKYNDEISKLPIDDTIKAQIEDFRMSKAKNGIVDTELLNSESYKIIHNIGQKAISISDLEKYAGCPEKYFIEKLLAIKTEDQVDLIMTLMEKGRLLHNILYLFYKNLQKENLSKSKTLGMPLAADMPVLSPVSLEPMRKQEYLDMLISIAESEFSAIDFNNPFIEIEKKSIIGTPNTTGILERWLNSEISRKQNGWTFEPGLFEFGFGMENKSVSTINFK